MRVILRALFIPLIVVLCVGLAPAAEAATIEGGPLTSGRAVTARVTTAGDDVRYTFTGTRGAHVTLDVSTSTWGSGSAYLRVYSPINPNSEFGLRYLGSVPTYLDFTLDSSGTWTVVVDPTGTAVGYVTFTYAVDVRGTLQYGKRTTTTINLKGQNAVYTFTGTKDSHVTLDVSTSGWGGGYAYLNVFSPSNPNSAEPSCYLGSNPTYCDFTLDAAGTWKVVVDPAGGSVGNVTVQLDADQNKGEITTDAQTTTTINSKGQNAYYTFYGVAGAKGIATVLASNWGGGYAYLRVFSPLGNQLPACYLGSSRTTCTATLDETGTWKAVIDPVGGAVGSVTFKPSYG